MVCASVRHDDRDRRPVLRVDFALCRTRGYRRPSGFFPAPAGVVKAVCRSPGQSFAVFWPWPAEYCTDGPLSASVCPATPPGLAEQGAVHHACRQVASLFGRVLSVLQIKLDVRMEFGAILPGDAHGGQGGLLLPGELQISIRRASCSPCRERWKSLSFPMSGTVRNAVSGPDQRAAFFRTQGPFRRNDGRGTLILKDDEIPGIPR